MARDQTRAQFIGAGAATISAAALAGAWRTRTAGAASNPPAATDTSEPGVTEGAFDPRFFGENFTFEIAGAAAGLVDSPTGGVPFADVVTEKIGPDHIQKKHLAGVKYEDITVNAGTGMSKGFYDWIKSTLDHTPSRLSGAVVAYSKGFATGRGEFGNALISEFGFPALDASSKDVAKMTIKFTPEFTRFSAQTGRLPGIERQTAMGIGSFKLDIDGLDTSRVSKIDTITIKQKFVEDERGGLEFVGLEMPNLAFAFDDGIDQSWIDFFQDFALKGNSFDDQERSGSLSLLDGKSNPLFTLTFSHLGIFKLTPEKVEAGGENIRRVKAELYVEDIRFSYSPSAVG